MSELFATVLAKAAVLVLEALVVRLVQALLPGTPAAAAA